MAVNCFTCLLVSSTCKIHPFTSFWRSFPRISQPNIDLKIKKITNKIFFWNWFWSNNLVDLSGTAVIYWTERKKERKKSKKETKNKGFELWPANVLTIVIQSSKSVVEINTGEKICFNFLSFPFTSNSKEILLIRASMFLSDYQKN
jgi:hypothetical protein